MPAPYPFGPILAADPSNTENVAKGGEILIYAPGDPSKTPLALTDLSLGMALPNPLPVNNNGFGPAFLANLDQVAWEGAGFTGTFESYGAMRDDAELSRIAAEAAAEAALQSEANTTAPTDEVVNTVITNPASAAHLSIAANIAYAVDPIEARISNIDNTADADKPVSNATQAALNGKASQTALDTKADKTALDTVNADLALLESVSATVNDLTAGVYLVGLRTAAKSILTTNSVTNTIGVWAAPFDCRISYATLTFDYWNIAANNTDYWQFSLRNRQNPSNGGGYLTLAEKSTKVTGGEGIVARVPWSYDAAPWTNQVLKKGDLLTLHMGAKQGAPVDIEMPVLVTFGYSPL